MALHPPGPWACERDAAAERHSNSLRVVDKDGEHVAKVWGANDEAVASAKLIAAAPELLEALANLERYLRDTPHHNAVEAAAARAALRRARDEA